MNRSLATLTGLAMIAAVPSAFADNARAHRDAAKFSDADIKTYASVAVKLNSIAQSGLSEGDKQAQVAAAVKASGMDPDKFNAITTASRAHPQIRQKIQKVIAEMTGPHMTGP